MPATPARPRRRSARLALVAIVAAGISVGCQATNTPESYASPVTKQSLLDACQGRVPAESGTTTTLASGAYCECAFGVFVDRVPYNDNDKSQAKYSEYNANAYAPTYIQLNADLQSDPNKFNELPASVREAVSACPREGIAGTTVKPSENVTPGSTPGSTPGTTAATTSGTATPGSSPTTAATG